jgi:hypothetical protein
MLLGLRSEDDIFVLDNQYGIDPTSTSTSPCDRVFRADSSIEIQT